MKKELKKKLKPSTNAIRYFSGELLTYTVPIQLMYGQAACTYSCS